VFHVESVSRDGAAAHDDVGVGLRGGLLRRVALRDREAEAVKMARIVALIDEVATRERTFAQLAVENEAQAMEWIKRGWDAAIKEIRETIIRHVKRGP
jgi:hypothetical protein